MTEWKPPLLGNKQPRPMGKPEKEWFDDPVRQPGSRPRTSDEPPKPVASPSPSPAADKADNGPDPRRRRK